MTSDMVRRVRDHKTGAVEGFTRRYGVKTLVHLEFYATMDEAIGREKKIKKWRRSWKIELIERFNPDWRDLYDDVQR